jgi:hypothetical protein
LHKFEDFTFMVKSILLSQAQYARRVGRSGSRISQLVRQGIIVLVNGRVDVNQADIAIQAAIDRSRQVKSEIMRSRNESRQLELLTNQELGVHTEMLTLSLTETRQQHEFVKMELSKLKLEIEKGNLVRRDQAVEWAIGIVSTARIQFLGLPRRTAGIFAALTSPSEIEDIHRKEIRAILIELARGFGLNDEGQMRGGEASDEQIDNIIETDGEQFFYGASPKPFAPGTSEPTCGVIDGEIEKGNSENP